MLHKIVEVLDAYTLLPSDSARHRVDREVHVSDLSLNSPAMLYHSGGATVTSPVKEWTENIRGDLKIVTENSIYYLEVSRNLLTEKN